MEQQSTGEFSNRFFSSREKAGLIVTKDPVQKNQLKPMVGPFMLQSNNLVIDLSRSHYHNPLGHSHPLLIDNPLYRKHHSFNDMFVCQVDAQNQQILFNDFLQLEAHLFSTGTNILNFHGHDFCLQKTPTKIHSESSFIIDLLKYYQELNIFTAGGYFSLLTTWLKEASRALPDCKVENLKLTIPQKKLTLEKFLKHGVLINEDQLNNNFITLYFPLAVLKKEIEFIFQQLQEIICSA